MATSGVLWYYERRHDLGSDTGYETRRQPWSREKEEALPKVQATAVSLFSGCGGFDLGAKRAGVRILWANDINPHAAATYRKYFPDVPFVCEDIRKVNKKRLPEADILIGCYPCQGFSSGAWRRWRKRPRRSGSDDRDNLLYLEFIAAIPFVKPKLIYIENVKGLGQTFGGWFLKAQVDALSKTGYRVYVKCLNAADFGVAQSRKRIFIVGVRKDLPGHFEFPRETHGPDRDKPYRGQADEILGMPLWPAGEFEDAPFHGHYLTRNRKRPWPEPSYTIVAHSRHVTLHPAGEPMRNVGKDKWELQGEINRRLSWRECALLQSFPSYLEPEGPMTAKYAQIGNAVPPPLAEPAVRAGLDYLASC